MESTLKFQRGDIYFVRLDSSTGSEQNGCVNSKIDKNYNPKQNTGKSKDIMRYAQKNIMKICIFKYEIVLTQNEKRANI